MADHTEAQERVDGLVALKDELEISRTNELLKLSGRAAGWVPDSVNVKRAHSLHETIRIVDEAIKSESRRIPVTFGILG